MPRGRRLFIGGVADRASRRDIERFFRGYGKCVEVVMRTGFAFVELDSSRDAEDAVANLSGRDLCGERVSLEFAKSDGTPRRSRGGDGGFGGGGRGGGDRRGGGRYGPPVRTNYRLVVKNLSSGVSWQDLKDLMRRAGEVMYTDAHRPNRGEGIVEFDNRSDMKRAIEKYDGYEWHGKRIRVVPDDAGRGGSRSRSRSRDRRPPARGGRGGGGSRSRSRSPVVPGARRRRGDLSPSPKRSRRRDSLDDVGRNGGRAASRSRSRSRSASRSPSRSRSPLPPAARAKSRSGSAMSKSHSRSRSRSRSGSRSGSASRSRSVSRSPVGDGPNGSGR